MSKIKQRISVRTLVEFVLNHGDLHVGSYSKSRLTEGTKAHQWLQKARGDNYLPEQSLSTTINEDDFILEIHGRADGVIENITGLCIEEIKSTTLDLDQIKENHNILHWAQAQCYAYLLADQNSLPHIDVQLTYIHLDSRETLTFTKSYSYDELKDFFFELVKKYTSWAQKMSHWASHRNTSIAKLRFPYSSYRPGQRDLVKAVYKTIKEGQRLFVQAPTGIGKTIGTLFPALKALEEGLGSPIFYLTARTITRTVAEESLHTLEKQGLYLKRLTLTAKDKICFCTESTCDPEECSFAKGYYDRLHPAVQDIFEENSWNRPMIESYARKHNICPFEFSLELSKWADLIICDYNYAFDPLVFLKHFFLEKSDLILLIDEAHNLVDRSREMFSAELNREEFLEVKDMIGIEEPLLAKRINTIYNHLSKLKKQGLEVSQDAPTKIYNSLERFTKEVDKLLLKWQKGVISPAWKDKLLDLYFKVLSFLRVGENYDENYVTYQKATSKNIIVKLFCINPSTNLSRALAKGKAAIFFSATLSPIEYFMQILGGQEDSYKLLLDSPFDPENLYLLVHQGIVTTYSKRSQTKDQIAQCVKTIALSKRGNYIVYFPSYDYLQMVYDLTESLIADTKKTTVGPKINIIKQEPNMTEEEREVFLTNFKDNPQETLIAFALLGGIFGEGIDLTGERLSAAIIVGVGLPQIGGEREIIRSYFETRFNMGFEFAYIYPGMNKVLQAAGRVIRTEKDKGVVVLIDERYGRLTYKKLFPKYWTNLHYVNKDEQITPLLKKFWHKNSDYPNF